MCLGSVQFTEEEQGVPQDCPSIGEVHGILDAPAQQYRYTLRRCAYLLT